MSGINLREELLRANRTASTEDIKDAMNRFSTLNAWVYSKGYYIRDSENDHREMSHTGLNGVVYSVPMRVYPIFTALLVRDLVRKCETYHICEFLTEQFPMFADFDIESGTPITGDEWMALGKVMQNTMRKCYGTTDGGADCRAAWYTTQVEKKRTEKNEVVYRYGLHVVWPKIIVEKRFALLIYAMLLADIKRYLPVPEAPSNSWDDRFDIKVYGTRRGKPGSLRMPGNEKIKPCKNCASLRRRAKKAYKKATTSSIAGGDDELKSSKSVTLDETKSSNSSKLNNDNNSFGGISCKYCDDSGKISVGRPYHPSFIFGGDGDVDKTETEKFQNNWEMAILLGSLRLPPGTPLTTTLSLPDNAPRIFDPSFNYNEDGSGSVKIEPNELGEGGDGDEGGDDGVSMANPYVDKDGNPIKEKKWRITKNQEHLREYLQFPENRANFKTRSERYKFRVENKNLVLLVQSAIRSYDVVYKDVTVIDLRCNKKTQPCDWWVIVGGVGSQYCLNKMGNHNSSSASFEITAAGYYYQICDSTKKEIRDGGCRQCKGYKSLSRSLPELVRDALTWKKKKASCVFGSLDEQLHFSKFESKQRSSYERVMNSVIPLTSTSSGSTSDGDEIKKPLSPSTIEKIKTNAIRMQEIVRRANARRQLKMESLATASKSAFGTRKTTASDAETAREDHLQELYRINFKMRDQVGLLLKEDKRLDESDIRNIRFTRVEPPMPIVTSKTAHREMSINEQMAKLVAASKTTKSRSKRKGQSEV